MTWLGKLVGGIAGALVAGPSGAVLGAILGHGFDHGHDRLERQETLTAAQRARAERAFRAATFATMGHLAKADGRVSPAEIALAEAAMARIHLTAEERQEAIARFKRGKTASFDLAGTLASLRRECQQDAALIELFLLFQLQAAHADGEPTDAQRQVLERIRIGLGLPARLLRHLESLVRLQRQFSGTHGRAGGGAHGQARRPSAAMLAQSYALLGVRPDDPDAVVKRAYRRLLSQHHPDKLMARGLPEDVLTVATEKTQAVRRAYELIQAARAA